MCVATSVLWCGTSPCVWLPVSSGVVPHHVCGYQCPLVWHLIMCVATSVLWCGTSSCVWLPVSPGVVPHHVCGYQCPLVWYLIMCVATSVLLYQPRIQDLAKGGAVLLEGRHIDNECMRSQGRIQKAGGGGGGGGGVLSVLGPIQKRGGGGGGVLLAVR